MTELINAEQLDEIARRHYQQAGPVVALIRAALLEMKAEYEAERKQRKTRSAALNEREN